MWPSQAAAAVAAAAAAAAAFSNVSSSSLQKKSLGANYSHKWSPAVEYKAWNVDFQLSFHLKLRKSACSINSLDPPPLKSYFPDFFFFTSQHAHLCRSSAAISLRRYICPEDPPGPALYQLSDNWKKKEEVLQSPARFVMFIACQPPWVLTTLPFITVSSTVWTEWTLRFNFFYFSLCFLFHFFTASVWLCTNHLLQRDNF